MHTPRNLATLLRDQRGNVAVSYIFVTALAIALGLAVVALRSPIRRASELAEQCLAENNP